MSCLAVFVVLIVSISNLKISNTGNLQAYLLRLEIQDAFENAKKLDALRPLNITKTLISCDIELKMKFYYMPGLLDKLKQGENRHLVKNQSDDPFINIDQGLFVRDFGTTHSLMFNKYNIYDKHMIIVTKEFEPQNSMISLEDMTYAGLTAQSLNGILYYNGGRYQAPPNYINICKSCQKKHILKFVQSRKLQENRNLSKIFEFPHFHFIHGIISFEATSSSLGKHLFSAYKDLYQHLTKEHGQLQGNQTNYNIIGCQTFLMMIFRRQQTAFGISVNALGYMGSILFKEGEEMESYYNKYLPTDILEEISFK